MSLRSYLILLAGIFWVPAFSNDQLFQLSTNRQWLKLLHYEGNKSRADGIDYFLAGKKGKTNPYLETLATYQAFKENRITGRLKSIAPCTYPARYLMFQKYFPSEFKPVSCSDYDEWLKGLDTSSVSLIFASSYDGNPASTFGHTFLRLNRHEKVQDQSDLLDYGLNFAATTGTDGGIEFAFFGLLGFYPGHFSLMPYYLKVNEYSRMENRNLYEYRLRLKPEEIKLLLAQVWEIENTTYFDYYFFDENCSYLLLMMVDAIKPDLKIGDDLKIFVTPLDTLKILNKHNLLELVKINYSLDNKLAAQKALLSPSDQQDYDNHLTNKTFPKNVSLLDLLIQYHLTELYRTKNKLKPESQKYYEELLSLRSKYKNEKSSETTEKKFILPPEQNVLRGHDSNSLTFGIFGDEHFQTLLQWRFGIHGLEDRDRGYLAFSSLEALKPTFAYDWKERSFYLKEMVFASAMSLQASTLLQLHPNWRFHISWQSTADRAHSYGNGVGTAELGGGLSAQSFWQSRIYLHAIGIWAHDLKTESMLIRPLMEVGLILPIREQQKIILKWREKFQDDAISPVLPFSSHGSFEHSLYLSDQSALLTQVSYLDQKNELISSMLMRFYY